VTAGNAVAYFGPSEEIKRFADKSAWRGRMRIPAITVSAGGFGAGRTGVCQGSLEFGMSDVQITSQERTSLNCTDAVQTAVAIQAFATAANAKGPAASKPSPGSNCRASSAEPPGTGPRSAAIARQSC
jgi:hypothetical protein